MVAAAAAGLGVELAPVSMFARDLAAEQLVRPFAAEVETGRCWLTPTHSTCGECRNGSVSTVADLDRTVGGTESRF
jgi:hypothetical protein